MPLTSLCLGGEEFGGPRQMDLEARKSPGGYFVIPGVGGEAISQEGFSPEGEKVVPRFATELN